MKRIFLYLLLLLPFIGRTQVDLWQLQWAPDSLYCISTLSTGEPVWMECADLPGGGGSGTIDSIFLNTTKDTIYLRDGSGFVSVADFLVFDSIYIQNDTIKLAYGGGAIPIGTTSNSFWALNGNNLTGERYLGTNTNHPLPIRLNGVERFRLTQAGRIDFSNALNNVFIEGGNETVTGDLNFTMGGLINLTSGFQNTTMGLGSGRNITNQSQNSLYAFNAGENLRSSGNIAMGINTLRGPISGGTTTGNQVAIGNFTLENHSGGGIPNVVVAPLAFRTGNPSGVTAMGTGLSSSGTGLYNSIFGAFAAGNYTTSQRLSTFGALSGIGQVTASGGTFFGYAAGRYEDEGDRLMIDAIDRGNKANGRANSIIYGVMNANRNNQILDLNAKVKPAIMGGTAVDIAGYDSDGYLTTASFTPPADVTINAGNAINVAGSNPYTISYTGTDSTTVSDTPTLDLTLTGNDISGVVDTSIIATQYYVDNTGVQSFNGLTGDVIADISRTGTYDTDLGLSTGSTIPSAIVPTGGTTGQVVKKFSNATGHYGWGADFDQQILGISGNTLSISNGNSVTLPTSTDAQIVARTGFYSNDLSISNGNTIVQALMPTGGFTGQIIQKLSNNNGDYGWVNLPSTSYSWNIAANGTAGSSTVINGSTVTINGGTGITATRSGNNITLTNTVTNTDNQLLSAFGIGSRSLSISGGNSLSNVLVSTGGTTGQVLKKLSNTSGDYGWVNESGGLPSASSGQSMRYNGSAWEATSIFTSFSPGGNTERLVVGSATLPYSLVIGSGTSGTRLAVAGGIQLVPTATAPNRIAGLTGDNAIGDIAIGSGLSLSGGTLSATAGATPIFGQLSNSQTASATLDGTWRTISLITGVTNGGMTASSSTLTIPSGGAGVYEVTYSLSFGSTGSDDNLFFGVSINGAAPTQPSLTREYHDATLGISESVSRTFLVNLSANSTLNLQYQRNSGSGTSIAFQNQVLSAKKID